MQSGDVRNGNVGTNTSQETQSLELWASNEVCASLGWTRAELKRARAERGFPEPMAIVAAGRIAVWAAVDVRAWWNATADRERKFSWRRAEAVRMYRRGETIAEICRQLTMKSDTVRVALRAAGETLPSERRDAIVEEGS